MADESTDGLEFRGKLTEDDAVDLRRCADALTVGRPIQIIARGLAALLGGLAVVMAVANGPHPAPIVTIILCSYVGLILPWEREWRTRRQYRLRAGNYLETTVRISRDGLLIDNDAQYTPLKWSDIVTVADDPAGLLFCNWTGHVSFWLPQRILGDDLRERVLAIVAANGVPVRRV